MHGLHGKGRAGPKAIVPAGDDEGDLASSRSSDEVNIHAVASRRLGVAELAIAADASWVAMPNLPNTAAGAIGAWSTLQAGSTRPPPING